jgi:NADH-quinone oxidoreductase subunit L
MHQAYYRTGSHEDAQDMRNMGGLRRYLPATWVLMWAATLAIAGVPPFAGFFSKDEILGATFARAHESTLADARWLGIPGSIVLYGAYALGIAAAFLTALYMTRMMLYTFHGPNRAGDREREYLGEAPAVMTLPLVVLGLLSVAGGWLNIPAFLSFLGPVGLLERWLEPVVGDSQLRVTGGVAPHLTHSVEYTLVGLAVAVAVAGIAFAVIRLRPARLVPKPRAVEEVGIERVLANKYYVDEAYDAAFVRPTYRVSRGLLWRGVDVGIIDGLAVHGSAYIARFVGWVGSRLQSGQVGTYAWALVIGVLAVLGAFTMR